MTQIGNNTSKSGASIQSRTPFECWRNGEFVDGSIGSSTAKRTQRHARLSGSRRRCQYQEGKEARKCCNNTQNNANRCFSATILFKLKGRYSTGHGSHIPLQDDGEKPMMDLAQSLQTWCARTQNWYEHVAASICADEEELTVARRPKS